jgi:hypothetical protein
MFAMGETMMNSREWAVATTGASLGAVAGMIIALWAVWGELC